MEHQRGGTQTRTQGHHGQHRQPARDRKSRFQKRVKNKGLQNLQREINIAKNLQR